MCCNTIRRERLLSSAPIRCTIKTSPSVSSEPVCRSEISQRYVDWCAERQHRILMFAAVMTEIMLCFCSYGCRGFADMQARHFPHPLQSDSMSTGVILRILTFDLVSSISTNPSLICPLPTGCLLYTPSTIPLQFSQESYI